MTTITTNDCLQATRAYLHITKEDKNSNYIKGGSIYNKFSNAMTSLQRSKVSGYYIGNEAAINYLTLLADYQTKVDKENLEKQRVAVAQTLQHKTVKHYKYDTAKLISM